MGNREEKNEILKRILPPARSSVNSNQDVMKEARESERRIFGSPNNKAVKAERRRRKKLDEIFEGRTIFQFNRALSKVLEGNGTVEDMKYVESWGRELDEYRTTKGSRVTIKVVDVVRSNKV